jgi:coenzyme PQQ precursor peptide PqqA
MLSGSSVAIVPTALDVLGRNGIHPPEENVMKIWNKPQVREQAVGMEVTAYLPAGIDLI